METITETTTGAIICLKAISDSNEHEYAAKVFITNIPPDVTDEQLKDLVEAKKLIPESGDCVETLIRADINGTVNQVWEQFKGLNKIEKDEMTITFEQLTNFSEEKK